MDNDNIKVKFVGFAGDVTLKQALKERKNPMNLETFFTAVNQVSNGCNCCKNEGVKVYAIYAVSIPQIEPTALSLCCECLQALPKALEVINIDSHGCPPTLIYSWREV